jgi:sulfite exporter TauE/SafE
MDPALMLAGFAMGIAATPHCVAMCGAPCAALTGGCARSGAAFQAGRLAGYAAGGALAAGGLSVLGALGQAAPALRPFWVVVHLAFLALGLVWLVGGRMPAFLQRRSAAPAVAVVRLRPLRAGSAGLAWVAWPCVALQGALAVAALAHDAAGGAFVMAAFGIGSAPALAGSAWLGSRLAFMRRRRLAFETLGLRIAGLCIVLASSWALMHGVWEQFAAWCSA